MHYTQNELSAQKPTFYTQASERNTTHSYSVSGTFKALVDIKPPVSDHLWIVKPLWSLTRGVRLTESFQL